MNFVSAAKCIRNISLTGVDPFTPFQMGALFIILGDRSHPIQSISLQGKRITRAVLEEIARVKTLDFNLLQSLTIHWTYERSVDARDVVQLLKKCPRLMKLDTCKSGRVSLFTIFLVSRASVNSHPFRHYCHKRAQQHTD
jgi:hypothetical protein